MTGCGRAALSGDDSALPQDERAVLERARALIPLLAERAPATTAARVLPPETIAEYHRAGILRILQPRRNVLIYQSFRAKNSLAVRRIECEFHLAIG